MLFKRSVSWWLRPSTVNGIDLPVRAASSKRGDIHLSALKLPDAGYVPGAVEPELGLHARAEAAGEQNTGEKTQIHNGELDGPMTAS